MSRENFEYEAGKALNLPTNIIELARKGDGYDHAFDSMNIMQPLNGWWHWWKAGAASMQSERDHLAAQLADVVAENAALKSGVTYFACGSEYGFDLFKDKQAAINTAQEEIDLHREAYLDGSDGWDEDVRRAAWGIVIQSAQGYDAQGKHTSDSQHTYQTCDYRLEDEIETPATDSFIAEQRAQGIEQWIASRNGAWNGTTKEAEKFAAQLRNEVKV